jgi:hypothetical protein
LGDEAGTGTIEFLRASDRITTKRSSIEPRPAPRSFTNTPEYNVTAVRLEKVRPAAA